MVNHINLNRRVNIITIEDPIEFLHRDVNSIINQREVGADTLSFHNALRHVLRQNPDVILIGEIRDMETLDTAIKAADTGHLVFSTLHTTDATQTINRVISFYPPHQHEEVRHLLSTALQAVVSLRLVPTKDGTGRVAASEILVNTAAVRDNIRDVKSQLNIPDLIKEGTVQYGMQSFDQSLMQWYTDGVISLDSALFYCSNPTEFQLQVQGIGGSSDRTFAGFDKKGAFDPTKTGGAAGLGAKRPAAPAAKPGTGAGSAGPSDAGDGVSGLSRDPFQR
jgi:twitching motility protein PilT